MLHSHFTWSYIRDGMCVFWIFDYHLLYEQKYDGIGACQYLLEPKNTIKLTSIFTRCINKDTQNSTPPLPFNIKLEAIIK